MLHSSQDYPQAGQTAAQLRVDSGNHCQGSSYKYRDVTRAGDEPSRSWRFLNHGESKIKKDGHSGAIYAMVGSSP